ncbi:hypothetical protein ES703_35630 [subsurface metagenome]
MMSDEEIMEIRKKLEGHEERISKLESLSQTKPEIVKKKISIKEFILSKKPKNDVQKTLTVGYYLEKYENFLFFSIKDLKSNFIAAREKVPKNIGDKVQLNIKKGHMMEVKEKKDNFKAWSLTNSGEKYIRNGFKKGE